MRNNIFLKTLLSIPAPIWALGLVTLLSNMANSIIFVLTPLYLTEVLLVNPKSLGLLEGLAEATAWGTRILAGIISDLFKKRKPLLTAAFSLAAFSKALFVVWPSYWGFLTARLTDRVSNGLQATPREALVSDLAPADLKGASFGLRQGLGMLGSFLGAILLIYVLGKSVGSLQTGFIFALIPPILALIILIGFVYDRPVTKAQKRKPFRWNDLLHLPGPYWKVLIISFAFMLANYSGAFIFLQSKKIGLTTEQTPWIMIIQNIMAFFAAYPAGWLSDRFGRRNVLFIGMGIVIISNFFMADGGSIISILIGVGLWGVHYGMNYSLLATLIADTAPENLRGTGFGFYYLTMGLALFLANNAAGWLWEQFPPYYLFYTSSGVVGVAMTLLGILKIPKSTR